MEVDKRAGGGHGSVPGEICSGTMDCEIIQLLRRRLCASVGFSHGLECSYSLSVSCDVWKFQEGNIQYIL